MHVGILLLDPSITEGHLLWNGCGSLNSPPSIHNKHQPTLNLNQSCFETLMSQALTSRLAPGTLNSSEPEAIIAPLYPLIIGQWLINLEYTFTGLFQVEWHIDASRAYEPQDPSRQRGPKELDDCLQRLHKWQRRLPFFLSWLQYTITSLEGRYATSDAPRTSDTSKVFAGVISDFHTLHARFSNLALRANKILNTATAITSIQENKRAIEQNQTLSLVTHLAFVFIPLSFVSSFLSMNGDLEGQTQAYLRFFETALPLSLMAFGVAIYGKHVREFWRGIQLEGGKKG